MIIKEPKTGRKLISIRSNGDVFVHAEDALDCVPDEFKSLAVFLARSDERQKVFKSSVHTPTAYQMLHKANREMSAENRELKAENKRLKAQKDEIEKKMLVLDPPF